MNNNIDEWPWHEFPEENSTWIICREQYRALYRALKEIETDGPFSTPAYLTDIARRVLARKPADNK